MSKRLSALYDITSYVVFLLTHRLSFRFKIGVVILLAIVPFHVVRTLPDGKLHVYVLDVGQGDAIFIQLPTGEQMLVDTGQDEAVLTHLGALMPFNDRHIEAVFISHPQQDHMGMLPRLVDNYSIGKVFINVPKWYDISNDLSDVLGILQKQALYSDDMFSLRDVSLHLVWPPRQLEIFENLDINYNSHMFYLTYHDFVMLFTGDAEIGDDAPFDYDIEWERIDVLKVPHHGSKNAVDADFLAQASPAVAIIPVGDNRFGHPDAELIEGLQSHGARVFRTDIDGTVHIVVDRHGWRVVE